MLMIVSGASIKSNNVLDEVSYALAQGKKVIPLLIEDCPIPFRVARLQWVSFTGNYDTSLEKLVATLRGEYISHSQQSATLDSLVHPTIEASNTPASTLPIKKTGFNKRYVLASVALVVLLTVVVVYFKFFTSPILDKSIAVLPFINLSNDPQQEYFSDGITEEILINLTKVSELKVIARNSVVKYKGTSKSAEQIGKELNVALVLTGTVQKAGNVLRITSQLINASNNQNLWAEKYDKELKDIFAIQSEVSAKVVSALKIKLTAAEKKNVLADQNQNTDAYNLYLQGKHFVRKGGKENFEKALDYYNQALKIDSSDPRILVAISFITSGMADEGYLSMEDGYRRARQAAEKALLLNSNSAHAHLAVGNIKMGYDWDWQSAETEIQKAVALLPGDAFIINMWASLNHLLGRVDTAILLFKKSCSLSPLDLNTLTNLAISLRVAGQWNESIKTFKKILELQPDRKRTHYHISLNYLLMNKLDSALAEIKAEPDRFRNHLGLIHIYTIAKNKAGFDSLIHVLKLENKYIDYQIAQAYGFANEADSAFKYLDVAYQKRDGGLTYIKTDPLLKNLYSDDRWQVLLTKMKLN